MPTQQEYEQATNILINRNWTIKPTPEGFLIINISKHNSKIGGPTTNWAIEVIALDNLITNADKEKKAAQKAWVLNYFLHGGYNSNPIIDRPYYIRTSWVSNGNGVQIDDLRFSVWKVNNLNQSQDTQITTEFTTPVQCLENLMSTLGITYADIIPRGLA